MIDLLELSAGDTDTHYFLTKFVIFLQETIQDHREVLDPKNPLDLIDSYLVEIEQHKNEPSSLFTGKSDLSNYFKPLFLMLESCKSHTKYQSTSTLELEHRVIQ